MKKRIFSPLSFFFSLFLLSFSFARFYSIGPETGTVNEVIYHPENPRILYAATDGGGVFKSTDGGESWNWMSEGLPDQIVNDLAFHKGKLFCSTAQGIAIFNQKLNLWERLTYDDTKCLFSSDRKGVLYAGSNGGGVFVSTDIGKSWIPRSSGLPNLVIEDIVATDNTVFIATYGNGLYRSYNGGINWERVPGEFESGYFKALAMDTKNPNIIFAGIDDPIKYNGALYKSNDGGNSWTYIREFYGVAKVEINPVYPHIVFMGNARFGLFISVDNGNSFNNVHAEGELFDNVGVYGIAINKANPSEVVIGTFGRGLFKTTDFGLKWKAINKGLIAADVYDISIKPESPSMIFAGTSGGVFRTNDEGISWVHLKNGLGDISSQIHNPRVFGIKAGKSSVFAGLANHGIFRSINEGNLWSYVGPEKSHIYEITFSPGNENIVYATQFFKLLKSYDNGLSWQDITGNCDFPVGKTIFCHPQRPELILFSAFRYGIFRSTNGGYSWEKADFPQLNTPYHSLYSIDFDSRNSIFYSAGMLGIFKSTDQGKTWWFIKVPEDSNYFMGIKVDIRNPNYLYAISYGSGFYYSPDAGDTWIKDNSGLASLRLSDIQQLIDGRLVISTRGKGLFIQDKPFN